MSKCRKGNYKIWLESSLGRVSCPEMETRLTILHLCQDEPCLLPLGASMPVPFESHKKPCHLWRVPIYLLNEKLLPIWNVLSSPHPLLSCYTHVLPTCFTPLHSSVTRPGSRLHLLDTSVLNHDLALSKGAFSPVPGNTALPLNGYDSMPGYL